MSDSNRTAVALVEELVPGTTPATPAFESLRVTGANLAFSKQTVTSKELRADRQITDLVTVGFQAGGDIPWEASYGSLDSQLRGSFQGEWDYASIRQNLASATPITAVSTTAYTVLAGAGTQYNSDAFAQYMLVAASGFTAAGNNRTFVAGAASSGTSVVMTGGVVDAAPVIGARLKCIGFQGPSGDLVAVAGGLGTQGLTSTTLDFTTMPQLQAGAWVYVGGPSAGTAFANVGVKGFCRIGSVAAHSLLFDIVPSTWAADTGTGKTVQVYVGDFIRNGVTQRSYSVELQYQDIAAPEFEYYTGMVMGQFDLTVQAKSILTGKTTFAGLNAAVPATARFTGATDVAAPTGDVMNASSNVGFLYDAGAPVAGPNFVLGFALNLDNNVRRNDGVGSAGSVAIKTGQAKIEATLNTYYGNNAILTKIRSSTSSGYCFGIIDNTGARGYIFDLPKIKFGDGNPTVPGIDTDRMLDTKVTGLRHPTLGYTISCQRFEAFGV